MKTRSLSNPVAYYLLASATSLTLKIMYHVQINTPSRWWHPLQTIRYVTLSIRYCSVSCCKVRLHPWLDFIHVYFLSSVIAVFYANVLRANNDLLLLLLRIVDIDECYSGDHNCLNGTATCSNSVGSYNCSCISGYVGDGTTSCIPTGEWYFANIILFKKTEKILVKVTS